MKCNNIFRRSVVLFVALMMLVSVLATGCNQAETTESPADNYPTVSINGIIPWGAGGNTDITSRSLTPAVEKVLGKTIIMTNMTGGAGTVGTQRAKDAKADGYTIFFSSENPSVYQVLGLSPISYADFEPLIISVRGSTAILVAKDSKYNTFEEFIADAKANPKKLNWGSSGVGSQPFVANVIMNKVDGIELNTVTFDGDGPLVTALMGKQVDAIGISSSVAMNYIKNQDLKCLTIMATKKLDALPDIPAVAEINPAYAKLVEYSGFFVGAWVHKDTDPGIVKKLQDAFMQGYKDAAFQDYMVKTGLTPVGITGDEAKKFTENFRSNLSWLIYDAGAAKESPEKFNIPRLQ